MKNTIISMTGLLLFTGFAQAGDPPPTMWEVMQGAANFKRLDQLKELIQQGADVNAPIGHHRMLMEGEDPAASVAAGTLKPTAWPLDIALQQGQVEMAKVLIASGAKCHGGELAWATFIANPTESLDMVTVLLAAGADPNSPRRDGFTPLFWACYRGNENSVKLLLAQPGIKLDETTVDGDTALMAAVEQGHAEIVEMVLQAGALTNPINSRDESAITLAKKKLEQQQAMIATLQSHSK